VNEVILNSNAYDRPSAVESQWAVLCPDIAHWVSAARLSDGNTAAARLLQTREGLKEDFVCLCTLSDVSNAGLLIAIFI
jgi:hypothetical protein